MLRNIGFRPIANVLAFACTVVVNGLAVALPLNGQDTGAIADRFAVYFVPADYVFSIWSLIYLLLFGFVIYQALPAQRNNPFAERIGYLFVLSCLANTAWIFLWHYLQFVLALVMIVVLLATLIAIYLRLGIGRQAISGPDRWLVILPFQVYLGWLTVATIANTTAVLYDLEWGGWGIAAEWWAIVMLAIACLLGAVVVRSRRDAPFVLVLAWAFAGIAVKHQATALVAQGAWAATVVAVILAIMALVGSRQQSGSSQPAS